jgi:hypothetical protein
MHSYTALTISPGGFDAARAVFKKASSALNAALAHYVMDGFVTEHVELLQVP